MCAPPYPAAADYALMNVTTPTTMERTTTNKDDANTNAETNDYETPMN